MRVVATAGHVDHGKSSLVLALTGTDPDRFEEEKRRGLTIDLGFAHTTLPSGDGISFIDVPGHVRFLRNMLAGVGGIDACMFVVAATEGWKPQSEEHLRILELLGVRHGIVALTKVDLVDDELRELAELDVADHVAGTFLDGAPIVPVAATAGSGSTNCAPRSTMLVGRTPSGHRPRPGPAVGRPGLRGQGQRHRRHRHARPAGAGRRRPAWSVGPTAGRPGCGPSRASGAAATTIGPGNRVALNLAGVEHSDVARGDAVVHPGRWLADVALRRRRSTCCPRSTTTCPRRGAYAAYVGSGEYPAKVRVLGTEAIAPGTERARAAAPRDRRCRCCPAIGSSCASRVATRPSAAARCSTSRRSGRRRRPVPIARVERVIAERGWVDVDELELLDRRAAHTDPRPLGRRRPESSSRRSADTRPSHRSPPDPSVSTSPPSTSASGPCWPRWTR